MPQELGSHKLHGVLWLSWVAGPAWFIRGARSHDIYTEELHIRTAGRSNSNTLVQLSFNLTFEIESRHLCKPARHKRRGRRRSRTVCAYDLFPAALGDMVLSLGVQELSLSLSSGRWDVGRWGSLPLDAYYAHGAEVWAWIEEREEEVGAMSDEEDTMPLPIHQGSADARWRALLLGLGAFHRVPIGPAHGQYPRPRLMEDSFTTHLPRNGFTLDRNASFGTPRLFYSHVSGGAPCTDTLAAILRTLPCRGTKGTELTGEVPEPDALWRGANGTVRLLIRHDAKLAVYRAATGPQGLASLLRDFTRILSADHLSNSLQLTRHCRRPTLHLHHLFTMLYPWDTRDKRTADALSWMVGQGSGSTTAKPTVSVCPLAQSSTVVRWNSVGASLDGLNGFVELDVDDGHLEHDPMAAHVVVQRSKAQAFLSACTAAGQPDITGGVTRTWIQNTHPTRSVLVKVLDPQPFFLMPLLHTLHLNITTHGNHTVMDAADLKSCNRLSWQGPPRPSASSTLSNTVSSGAKAHGLLEYAFDLPAQATACVTLQFRNRYLHFEDFPSNPMRGMWVPPPVIALHEAAPSFSKTGGCVSRVTGNGLLIDVPTPDFSMPFNVVTLTSTLLAFFFGTMINVLVKKSGGRKAKQQSLQKREGLLSRLRRRLRTVKDGVDKKKDD